MSLKDKGNYYAGAMIGLREGTLNEIEKTDWWQIFTDGDRKTAVYFKEDKSRLRDLVKKMNPDKTEISLYIFSWGKNEYLNEFPEYPLLKVNDIPEPLIEVFKEINKGALKNQ